MSLPPGQLCAVLRATAVLSDTIAGEVLKELYAPSVTVRGIADTARADRVWAEARALSDDGTAATQGGLFAGNSAGAVCILEKYPYICSGQINRAGL